MSIKKDYTEVYERLINKEDKNINVKQKTLFKCDICGKEVSSNLTQVYDVLQNKGVYRCASCYQRQKKKKCINCGNEREHYAIKFCSGKCQQDYTYKIFIERWKQGLENGMKGKKSISKHIRRYLFEKYNNKCQLCGWGETNPYTNLIPLQIHHIDGDCHNNSEENLQLLCPNCHALTETFCALNIGNSTR